jgi:hypothetical protein
MDRNDVWMLILMLIIALLIGLCIYYQMSDELATGNITSILNSPC